MWRDKHSWGLMTILLTYSFLSAYNAAAEFHPGPMLLGRLAAKKLKEMRAKEDCGGADTNKDGGLDKKEVAKAKETHGLVLDDETFKKIDKNGDGVLSHEECEQFHKEQAEAEKKEAAEESSKETGKTSVAESDKEGGKESSKDSGKLHRPKIIRQLLSQ